jgi:hypothetical protein
MKRKFTMALVALASLGTLRIFAQTGDEVRSNHTAISGTGSSGFTGIKEFTASGKFVVPSTVTTILAELYGGGGGGGAECGGADGGGGGGGAFTRSVIGVTPGSTLTVQVAAGGAVGSGSPGNGTAGGNSSISDGTTKLVFADGGGGGQGGCDGSGGGAGGAADPGAMISHAGQAGTAAAGGFSGIPGNGYCAIGFFCEFTIGQGGWGFGGGNPTAMLATFY